MVPRELTRWGSWWGFQWQLSETLLWTRMAKESMKWSKVAQSCLTLCDPKDCNLPGSSIHGIFQARILEQVAICFSRRSSWSRDWTWVSGTVGRRFTIWATKKERRPDWDVGDQRTCEVILRDGQRVRRSHLIGGLVRWAGLLGWEEPSHWRELGLRYRIGGVTR